MKAEFSITFTLSGNSRDEREEQPSNASIPIFVKVFGIIIDLSDLQFLNANQHISSTPSERITVSREVQFSKADLLIFFILPGIVIVFSEEQFLKVALPKACTLFGIMIEASAVQPSNAPLSTASGSSPFGSYPIIV